MIFVNDRRRKARLAALLLGLIAVAFYVSFFFVVHYRGQ